MNLETDNLTMHDLKEKVDCFTKIIIKVADIAIPQILQVTINHVPALLH